MPGTPAQIAETLANFYRDFGPTDVVAKAAAKRMKIRESVALDAARAYRDAQAKVLGSDPGRERHIRESVGRLTERANAAEAKGLRNASLQELEAVAAITFGI